jgi:hypothetical protein
MAPSGGVMNYNKKTTKAVKVEEPKPQPRPIVISNQAQQDDLIEGGNLTGAETGKAYSFFAFHGKLLPVGTDLGSYLKSQLGDIHYEKVGNAASIRISQEKRIQFTQTEQPSVIQGNPDNIVLHVTNVGSPTYAH